MLKQLKVLCERRQGHFERSSKLCRRSGPPAQLLYDGAPGGIGKCVKNVADLTVACSKSAACPGARSSLSV
ncbi:MAG: hypothetical protein ABIO63_00625, partial [Casimicrobiaceae bacterium]